MINIIIIECTIFRVTNSSVLPLAFSMCTMVGNKGIIDDNCIIVNPT